LKFTYGDCDLSLVYSQCLANHIRLLMTSLQQIFLHLEIKPSYDQSFTMKWSKCL